MENKDNRDYRKKASNSQEQQSKSKPTIVFDRDHSIANPDNFDEGDYEDINDNIPVLKNKLENDKDS